MTGFYSRPPLHFTNANFSRAPLSSRRILMRPPFCSGAKSKTNRAMHDAVKELAERFGTSVLLKGGHLRAAEAVDLLFHNDRITRFSAAYISDVATHGTGLYLLGGNYGRFGARPRSRVSRPDGQRLCHPIDSKSFSVGIDIRTESFRGNPGLTLTPSFFSTSPTVAIATPLPQLRFRPAFCSDRCPCREPSLPIAPRRQRSFRVPARFAR